MSLILVATVCGVLLERRSCARPERRVGVRRGRCGWTRPATVRGPPTAVFDRPLCQKEDPVLLPPSQARARASGDRKSTRLNSSHANISYAVFCLKKKKLPPIPSNFPH